MVDKKYIDKLSFGTKTGDGKNEFSLEEEELKKLENPSYDLEKEEEGKQNDLYESYVNIVDMLKKYCDLNEQDYPIVATWIIGTYFHKDFHSYPYLFLNAMKGSGKTRTLKLISDLSFEGEILLQPTEAVLFRTTGTLGIDEAEGIARKGTENLRELLNGCYKRGTKVKRMKQKKNEEGNTEQVVEEFEIYRPLALANINGMEDVLGDRCLNIVLERSTNHGIVKLAEIWSNEEIFIKTKEMLKQCSLCGKVQLLKVYTQENCANLSEGELSKKDDQCSLCGKSPRKGIVEAEKVYKEWNDYIYTNYILHTYYTNNTKYTPLFKSLDNMDLNGREVELCLPLLLLGWHISEEVYKKLHDSIKEYMKDRKQDQFNESRDVMLIDMISQEPEEGFQSVKTLVNKFLEFTQEENEDREINPKWMGRALKRLKLIIEKKRLAGGIYVKLNYSKAQEKILQYK